MRRPRRSNLAVAVLACTLATFATPATAQGTRSTQTDQTVNVTRGTRFSLDSMAGEVIVRGWDRDAVRVQARHASRTRVSVRSEPSGTLVVSASGSSGPPGSVDYDINVPSWMPVSIEGTFVFITVEGTAAEITAETVHGDVAITGGATLVRAKSIAGEVEIDGARGRIEGTSVNQGVTIARSTGEIVAETVTGSIVLSNVDAANAEAGTVNGHIRFESAVPPRGKYRFSAHNGNIMLAVPDSASATFSVRTYHGSVQTNLPLKGDGDTRRGRRAIYTLGSGGADFDIETFNGSVHLRRPGTLPEAKPSDRDRSKEKTKEKEKEKE